ncbi:MAG TPA: SGNH/GDSL hydrolase family protein [Solirubrobacterales bacterium]|nr:SGNH/GDSL hydrolase family protein [Solirubrobacterales bacterium]
MTIRRHWWVVLLAAAAIAGLVALGLALWGEPSESAPLDPNPDSSFRIVALGDSYISGEGARRYFPGTDEPGGARNMCHRAKTAHPYLLAQQLEASLVFVACSGARMQDVTGVDAAGEPVSGQYPRSGEEVYGALPQVTVLREVEEPDAVLISIGGNDAGFAEIGKECAIPARADCRRQAQRWLERLDAEVYPALVRTYSAVREAAPGAAVFALTYPNPIGPRFCDDLVGLNPAEMDFIREVFVGRLNEIVATAAAAAGIRSIDLTAALVGHRFCEVPLGKTAINFVQISRTQGAAINVAHLGGLANGSLHPNPLGHELLATVVRGKLEELQASSLPPAPSPDPAKRPPPFVPAELGLPGAPRPFPPNTDCDGSELAAVSPMSARADQRAVQLTGVRPGSTVCFRTYRAEWKSKRVGADGEVEVPIDVSRVGVASINEILVEGEGGSWKAIVVSRFSLPGGG